MFPPKRSIQTDISNYRVPLLLRRKRDIEEYEYLYLNTETISAEAFFRFVPTTTNICFQTKLVENNDQVHFAVKGNNKIHAYFSSG